MVKNPLSHAGDLGSIPGGGTEVSHAVGQISPSIATREKITYHNKEPTFLN